MSYCYSIQAQTRPGQEKPEKKIFGAAINVKLNDIINIIGFFFFFLNLIIIYYMLMRLIITMASTKILCGLCMASSWSCFCATTYCSRGKHQSKAYNKGLKIVTNEVKLDSCNCLVYWLRPLIIMIVFWSNRNSI